MDFKYKVALVTGGAGFIGSHIVEELVKLGVTTISVDNYFAGKRENLSHLKSYSNLIEVNCDITDYNELEKYFKDVEIVFHNAASKKTICLNDPRRDLQINAEGAFNLLELSVKYGVKKFVHASTGSVYGEAVYYPQDEKHPLSPTSYYGVSKLAGERYVKVFEHLYNLDTTILRYFHVYGPRQDYSDVGGVVSIFIRNILLNQPIIIYGDGSQQRSFTYVKDVVKSNLTVAANPFTKGQVYNCASGIKITINELARRLKDIFSAPNHEIIYKQWQPGDIKVFDILNQKLIDLGYQFDVSFESGLRETIRWSKDYFAKIK